MAQGIEAQNLQNQAQGHRWDSESVVADSAHSHQPGDYNWQEAQPGELAIDPLMRAEPEEADKEEADSTEHPHPGDELSNPAIDEVIALLTATSDIKNGINL